ncbi:hypothetical protein BK636_02520 [Pseudomonas chlororaphis]|uniref:Nmad2 family putative nucleotide modification protein n=1 Tax=Pseudomonas chlororaphis TaxID=587753 RepID=UPI000F469CC3|nr:hypothetical protein [Pseudomonas chlororaphis]ROL92383.1 hypothetical protein BK636_02520 [Pseudomonas chlororaphis]
MTRIYGYVITHDTGFAPNPYGGVLTLATCKPVIRRTAKMGDWLVGTGSASRGLRGKLVYAAKIDKVLTLEEYGRDPQYVLKRPSASGDDASRQGDNLYFKDEEGDWFQRESDRHDCSHMDRDLSGKNVLIAKSFWYFGSKARDLPESLQLIIKTGPGHKCTDSPEVMERLEKWLSQFELGVVGEAEVSGLGSCGSC